MDSWNKEKMATLKPVPRSTGVDRDGPITSVAFDVPGCRPGYPGVEESPSAPDFLDFAKSPTILKDLPEDAFRQAFVDTLLAVQDLGLNRAKGEDRAKAYLDMVTWDANIRTGWANENASTTSSCGMLVRNVWWLCGARGTILFDVPYKPSKVRGVLTDLIKFDSNASRSWGAEFNAKTFFPKIGDTLYLYNTATNSQHIFIICAIDKKIVDVDGVATVFDGDVPASEITFTSVDGGQLDGLGPDENGKTKNWGCQGVHLVHRKMTLKDGHFLNLGNGWPSPGKSLGRPLNTWISIWEARNKFTAQQIKPIRIGPIGTSTATGAPIKKVDPLDDIDNPVDFYTWPNYTSPVPESILKKVAENRKPIPLPNPDFLNFYVTAGGEKTATGYSYPAHGKNLKPTVCSPNEEAEPHLKAIFERLQIEMAGEGGVSAILTGDGASFTWGRGLGHKGALEPAFLEFITQNKKAKTAFLDCGITLEDKTWKIVDVESNTVQTGDSAIGLLNGTQPVAVKKQLLSVFIKITEDHLASASQAQWDTFKKLFFYNSKIPDSIISTWSPEAICYVIHCHAWGKFATWARFETTGGDLRKILRLEVDYTGYFEDKGSYILVNPVQGNVTPSSTMLFNMGARHMLNILESWKDTAEMQSKVQAGDVVFKVPKQKDQTEYYVLRGTTKMFDSKNKYDIWMANHQGLPMASLLAELGKLDKKELAATRERYLDLANPNKEKFGMRPLVAIHAVTHKNEGLSVSWVFDKAKAAGITLEATPDQYNAISKTIGIDKYDAWVEKHQGLPMDALVREIGKLGYKETQATRDWYTSSQNQKKEKWGLRPRVAMDAVLHKNEGPGAGWILNDAERAGITATGNWDQYEVLMKTIGMA